VTFDEVILRLQQAREDPNALALATVDVVLTGDDRDLHAILEAAAVPHWFSADILARVLDVSEAAAEKYVERLGRLSMVESFAGRGWNVHEATRIALRARLAGEQQEQFRVLSSRAAACFAADEPTHRLERVYHRLIAEPAAGADELGALWKAWTGAARYEILQRFGVVLGELLRIPLAPEARARCLVCYGTAGQDRLPLTDVQGFAQEAVALFQQLRHASGEADARQLLGETLLDQGYSARALAEFESCRDLILGFPQQERDSTDGLHDLASAHASIGLICEAQDRRSDALSEFDTAIGLLTPLVERNPDRVGHRRDLAIVRRMRGRSLYDEGRLDEAADEYQASLNMLYELLPIDPENRDWQRELSSSHRALGLTLERSRAVSGALGHFIKAKRLVRQLVEYDPRNTNWRNDLSVYSEELGRLYEAEGMLSEALREYEEGKAEGMRLATLDPANTSWQRNLSFAHWYLARFYGKVDMLQEALSESEAALAIVQKLAQHDETNTQWQEDLETMRRTAEELRARVRDAENPDAGSPRRLPS
jgi:tetratricopeptide (TPR) repeat protein